MTIGVTAPAGVPAWMVDPRASRLTIRAFAGGVLSALGHSPTFAPRDYQGEVRFDPETLTGSLVLRINTASIAVQGDMSEKDRREIERTMRDAVLEVSKYPEILYACPEAAVRRTDQGQLEIALPGSLTLHGVTLREAIAARATVMGGMLRAFGEFVIRQSDYDITPVAVAGGALRVKDELKGAFDIVARR